MLWIIFGVLTFGFGVWALFQGRLKLSKTIVLHGNAARVSGIVLILAPVVGALFTLQGQGDTSYIFGASCYGILGVLAFAFYQGWKSRKQTKLVSQAKRDPLAQPARKPVPVQEPPAPLNANQPPIAPPATVERPGVIPAPQKIQTEEKTPIHCPRCGNSGYPHDKYCRKCGSPMTAENQCRKCGTIVLPGDRYCVKCGTPTAH